jgi:protocatechuate 3,4-dioxygenase beta subunit
MPQQHQPFENSINRRAFLKQSLMLPGALLILSCASPASNTASVVHTTPTPQAATTPQATISDILIVCSPGTSTPSQTEGPFYKPGSPERTSLREPGLAGTPLTVSGFVLSATCQPIAHAWLDFWQADSNGNYDNTGFRLRGHQYTSNYGQYSLATILPGEYPGRTRHIHVKVQASGHSILTTQLYFPAEPRNDSDGIFSPDLLMNVQNTPNGLQATFSFVLPVQ